MDDINIFDAQNQLIPKLERIHSLANGNITPNNCYEVLSELHTACYEESCTTPNNKNFQLSTEKVCSAVNSKTKLKVLAMGEYFDFRSYGVYARETKRVFVTSQRYRGDLGGVVGADSKCQYWAEEGKLGGRYKAWLTTMNENNMANRLDIGSNNNVPYTTVKPDGRGYVISNDWEELTGGEGLKRKISMTSDGADHSNGSTQDVWTATDPNGRYVYQNTSPKNDCNQWTSSNGGLDNPSYMGGFGHFGTSYSPDTGVWTNRNEKYCINWGRLYCFQQDTAVDFTVSISVHFIISYY